MIRNSLVFSLVLSLISVTIVLVVPGFNIIEDNVSSPYREQLDELTEKGKSGLTDTELAQLKELIAKNNQWFKHNEQRYYDDPSIAWNKKSSNLSPVIMLVWLVLFYFFHRLYKKFITHIELICILSFPFFFFLIKLMPLYEIVLITLSVLLVRLYFRVAEPLRPG